MTNPEIDSIRIISWSRQIFHCLPVITFRSCAPIMAYHYRIFGLSNVLSLMEVLGRAFILCFTILAHRFDFAICEIASPLHRPLSWTTRCLTFVLSSTVLRCQQTELEQTSVPPMAQCSSVTWPRRREQSFLNSMSSGLKSYHYSLYGAVTMQTIMYLSRFYKEDRWPLISTVCFVWWVKPSNDRGLLAYRNFQASWDGARLFRWQLSLLQSFDKLLQPGVTSDHD